MSRQPTRDELEDRLDTLAAAVEDLRADRDHFSAELAQFRERVEDLEAENRELRERLPDDEMAAKSAVDETVATLHNERVKLSRRVAAIEEDLGLSDVAIDVAEGRNTPLHLLRHVGPEAIDPNPNPVLRRAKSLLENKNRWGQTAQNRKYGPHRYLSSKKHDLRTRLEDARGESLQWSQVHRAMRKLAELGDNAVAFDETESRGKMVVFCSGWSE